MFQYGLALAQSELLSDAKKVFETVLELNESHSDALYNLGVISLFEEDVTSALAYFDEALKYNPNHVLAANGKRVARGSNKLIAVWNVRYLVWTNFNLWKSKNI